ncbi:MAG: restriction endonuclease subunit S [Peptococcaceae bacterium]
MKWEKVKLGNVCDSISDGDHQAPPKTVSGIPFVTISNINSTHQFDFSDVMYVSEDYYDNLDEKRKARIGDILYTVVGSFGIPVLIKEHKEFVFQRHIAILRPKSCIDSRFLYYTMLSRDFYKQADAVALGAAQRTVSLTSLRNMEIELPPIETQKCIADILSAYDDLIENNQKQIKLLEEAARRLYKEWFVDLHFPDYEHTKIVDGVPEGWERSRLIDIAEIQYGFAFDGFLFNSAGNGTPIVRIRNIPSGTTSDYTTEDADKQYIICNGDIVVGMDGEFHINSWCDSEAYLVQRTCSIKPCNKKQKGYLFWAIYEPIKYFEKTIVGATVAHLGKKHLDSIYLLTAPETYYIPFQLFFDKRQILLNQIRHLQQSRGKLLPKLMNGEIEV